MADRSLSRVDDRTGLLVESVAGPDIPEPDQQQILRLFNRAFGWGSSDLPAAQMERLQWELEGPPGQPSSAVLVRDGTRIVGLSMTIDLRFLARGENLRARLGAHAAVDPDYQGRGVDSARRAFQVDYVEPQFDVTLTFTTHPAIVHGISKHGDAGLGNPLHVMFKVVDTRRAAAELRERRRSRLPGAFWSASIAAASLWTGLRRRRPPTAPQTWSLRTVERLDERMDAFALAAAEPFDFIQLRRQDYLNWRLCDIRAGEFTVRLAEQDGEVLGYSAVHELEGRGYIVDLLALPGRDDVVRSLVGDAVTLLRRAGVYGVDCWMATRHPYRDVLRNHGFFDSRRDPGFSFRTPHQPGLLAFLQDPAATTHLMMADSDGI